MSEELLVGVKWTVCFKGGRWRNQTIHKNVPNWRYTPFSHLQLILIRFPRLLFHIFVQLVFSELVLIAEGRKQYEGPSIYGYIHILNFKNQLI